MEVKEAELRPERAAPERTIEALESVGDLKTFRETRDYKYIRENLSRHFGASVPILELSARIENAHLFPGCKHFSEFAVETELVIYRLSETVNANS